VVLLGSGVAAAFVGLLPHPQESPRQKTQCTTCGITSLLYLRSSMGAGNRAGMKPDAAAHTLCLGEPSLVPIILMALGIALLSAVGLLVFLSGRRSPPATSSVDGDAKS